MDENITSIGKKIIKEYINAFNDRDSKKMAKAFNFPHIRFANDTVTTISKEEYLENQENVTKLLMNEKWDRTKIKSIKNIQNGPSKGHFIIHFIRLDKFNNIIHDFKTLWIVTKIKDHWGIQFRSSFLTSKAATFGQNIN